MEKAGNGFISKIGLDGEIIDLKWAIGLDAPTGLGVYDGKLYTTDIDRIIEIDLKTSRISAIYPVEGAKAFNDVAVSPEGVVYCSDTGGNQIFALKDGKVSRVMADIDTPNGLLVDQDRFLVICWNPKTMYYLNLDTKDLTTITEGVTWPDGIEAVGDGGYFVSGLKGLIYYVDSQGNKSLLLDRSTEKIQAADIDYIISKNLLIVPGLNSNRVVAYQVKELK